MTQPGASTPDARFGLGKVYVGGEVCKWLYVMKGRLQMEEGAICRLAICLSLGERYAPDPSLIDQDGGKVFSVASLSGPPLISKLLFAFLRQRMFDDGLDPHDEAELERQFRAHFSRGMLALGVRVKHLADVGRLVQEAQERFMQSHPGIDGDGLDPTPTDEAEHRSPDTQLGALPSETGQAGRAGEAEAVAPLLQLGGAPAQLSGAAGSLWGALLPTPVKVDGAIRSARKKRGVTSARKKRRRRR